ncbi:lipopolysaccharide biosynthesis protein [Marinilabilia salmonicolor]|uniref:O-antigen/teichoic acid export membrane protein n=1 Tax=Marinilabilia salmonicolor TaxID=989 RepID=A0A368UMP6_9BACT|nr:lipopolysaccharide biosynthesis protein [Marinilabilia salmonicolor]RCW30042.1 O-antigen/teichoic acid export membrane protein [Marinilabilia salmonicolor]
MSRHVFLWSGIGKFGQQFVSISLNILTARILSPEDYGLIGVLSVFLIVSNVFIEGGFKDALIRENQPNDKTYSSVFFLNGFIGLALYFVLFFSAPFIADFFENIDLIKYSRVLFLSFVFNGLSVVPFSKLVKELDFRNVARINIVSSLIGGTLGLLFAYIGAGAWALVINQISRPFLRTILMYYKTSWLPELTFQLQRIKPLFRFGVNLLISGVIAHVCANILKIIIGKFYTLRDVGYYDRASNMQGLAMSTLSDVLNEVTYPILANSKDNLKEFKNLMRITIYLSVPVFVFLIVVSNDLIIFLLTTKWAPVIPIFRILSIVGIFYASAVLNNNMLKVYGLSRIVLINETIRNILLLVLIYFFRNSSVLNLVLITVLVNVSTTFLYMLSVEIKIFKGCILFETLTFLKSISFSLIPIALVYSISLLQLSLFFSLLAQTGVMFSSYFGFVYVFNKSVLKDMKALILD